MISKQKRIMLYRHDTIAKMNYEEHQALLELESFSGVGFEIREILRDDVYCITLDEKGNISGICTETECTGFFGIKLGWVFQKFPKITKILLRTRKKLLRKSRSPPMQGTLSRSLEQKVNSLPHAQAQVLEEFLGSTFPVPEKISDEFSRGVAFGEKRDRIWIKGLWLCNISRNISEFQKKLKKIAQCKGITHLYVRDNEISRIPLEWMAFENLQVLDLRDNKLIYNPSSWLPGVSVLLEGNPVGIPNSSARPKYFSSRSEKALRTHRKNVCSSWKYHNKKVLIFKGFHSKFHHISRDFGGGDPVCCPVCGTVIFECTEDIGDNGSYLCPLCKKDICIVNTPYESRAFYIKDNKWSYIV